MPGGFSEGGSRHPLTLAPRSPGRIPVRSALLLGLISIWWGACGNSGASSSGKPVPDQDPVTADVFEMALPDPAGSPSGAITSTQNAAASQDAVTRGAYLAAAGGCENCHTIRAESGPPYAGGAEIKTVFGTFFGTNLTPEHRTGIGGWSLEDFVRAMRRGESPDGRVYWPAFPYPSFTRMSDGDLADLFAYLQSVPPIANEVPRASLAFPYSLPGVTRLWRALNLREGPEPPDPGWSGAVTRGAYLTRAVAHCGECHSPRDRWGGIRRDRELSGAPYGVQARRADNLTSHREEGLGEWSADDIVTFLELAMDPGGDVVGGVMGDIVEHGTARLTLEDRAAIAAFLKQVPAIPPEE